MSKEYVTCPYCGCEEMEQEEWDDLCESPEGEIEREERWRCCDCNAAIVIHAHYTMDRYIPEHRVLTPDGHVGLEFRESDTVEVTGY